MQRTNLDAIEPFVTKDGSQIRELARTAAQSLAEATVPPGATTIRHLHRVTEELYAFTAGAGEMELDGEAFAVRAGDTVVIPPGAPHGLRNTGDVPLVLLCCCVPPYSHDDTVLLDA
jgi:mannose-6-phosphate isomerase-like protein (cupin superfamily)